MSHSISFIRVDSPPNILSPIMDTQDSSIAPPLPPPQQQPQPLHNNHHHHLIQQQQHLLVGPNQHLQQQSPNSYEAAAAAVFHSSSVSAANNNNTMVHHHQNQLFHQLQQHQQSCVPFSSMVNSAPQIMQSMDYPDGGNVTSPPGGGGVVGSGSGVEAVKRKRGRPRKYPADGSASGIAIGGGGSSNPTVVAVPESGDAEPRAKKHRGRPPGSGKKQLDALGVPGLGFSPHVIRVNPGEDIAAHIMAYTQQGPRSVCILTANGAVCNVTLRQPATSGSSLMYEGIFEIISLSGSFLMSENNGVVSRNGGLSVALAKPDGTVLGGGVAGPLKAATHVQIIVASFLLDEKKQKSMPALVPPPNMLSFVNAGATEASPPSQGGGVSSNSSEENGSPLDQGAYANAGQPLQNLPLYPSISWESMHPN